MAAYISTSDTFAFASVAIEPSDEFELITSSNDYSTADLTKFLYIHNVHCIARCVSTSAAKSVMRYLKLVGRLMWQSPFYKVFRMLSFLGISNLKYLAQLNCLLLVITH